jgi:hypothetical protein
MVEPAPLPAGAEAGTTRHTARRFPNQCCLIGQAAKVRRYA